MKPAPHDHMLPEDIAECCGPDDDDPPDIEDEFEEALANCSQFVDDGYIVCGAIGSEQCDFECPFRCDLGKRVEVDLDEAVHSQGSANGGGHD